MSGHNQFKDEKAGRVSKNNPAKKPDATCRHGQAGRQGHWNPKARRSVNWLKLASYSGGLLLFIKLTFSYLDPGSGSLIIQILVAGFLSLTFFVGMFWRKIKSLFGFAPKNTADELTETSRVKSKPEDKE